MSSCTRSSPRRAARSWARRRAPSTSLLLFDPNALRYLLDFVGPTQVVVGSDYPFLDVPPQWPLSELDLPDATRHTIRETNARAFLGR